MAETKKIDVFDRLNRSRTKPDEWKVPNKLRTSIKKKKQKGEDIQEYIYNPQIEMLGRN